MKKKYRVMFLVGEKLVTAQAYATGGAYVNSEFKEHYDTAKDAERDIFRAAKKNPASTIEYVIVPTYWYDSKCSA